MKRSNYSSLILCLATIMPLVSTAQSLLTEPSTDGALGGPVNSSAVVFYGSEVKSKSIEQKFDVNGNENVLLVDPVIKIKRQLIAGSKSEVRTSELRASQARVVPGNEVMLIGSATVLINGTTKFSGTNLNVDRLGTNITTDQPLTIVRVSSSAAPKSYPGEEDPFTTSWVNKQNTFSCSAGSLRQNGSLVSGNRITIVERGLCYTTVWSIGCDNDSLNISNSESFNGCSGIF